MLPLALMSLLWHELAPLPQPQGGAAVALHHRTIVVAGGTHWRDSTKLYLNTVQLYDTVANRWSLGPSLPYPLAYGAFFATTTHLTILGGASGERWRDDTLDFHFATRSWRVSSPAPAPTLLGRAVVHHGAVYLFGGCASLADFSTCSDNVFRRLPNGSWEFFAKLPTGPLALFGAASAAGEIFLFGGCQPLPHGGIENQRDVFAFRPDTRQWRRVTQLPHATRGVSAVAASDTVIYVMGGYSTQFTDLLYRFDAAIGALSPAGVTALPLMTDFLLATPWLYQIGGEDRMRHRTPRVFRAVLE